ncbi:MAG: orotate phosphoribosyltransferase [Sulfobacillus thermosulfidooxidans]|uniref:Orotate phosphoribosyltransferase n=1 Tax=Sulfobacillus thermosulfidooxidans TaxID=28034 RepID=A0A2T2X696_SULTH|nr:MAG: orotate phosphoribosyltransferase [Sulfobacillus thermosulfidooxidans]
MSTAGTLEDLREIGAYLQGHFLLTTGRHSDTFFLLARLTERPDKLRAWISLLQEQMQDIEARTVVGPAMGGIIPAYQLAALRPSNRVIFAEKGEGGKMVFRRGFQLEVGEPVIIVEDAVTTGSSVNKVIDAVIDQGAHVAAVGCLVNRTQNQSVPWRVPFFSVLNVSGIQNWAPDDCPLCRQGIPLTKPKQ